MTKCSDYIVGGKYYKLLSYDYKTDKHTYGLKHIYELLDVEYLYGFIPMGIAYCKEKNEYVNGNLFILKPVDTKTKEIKQLSIFDILEEDNENE